MTFGSLESAKTGRVNHGPRKTHNTALSWGAARLRTSLADVYYDLPLISIFCVSCNVPLGVTVRVKWEAAWNVFLDSPGQKMSRIFHSVKPAEHLFSTNSQRQPVSSPLTAQHGRQMDKKNPHSDTVIEVSGERKDVEREALSLAWGMYWGTEVFKLDPDLGGERRWVTVHKCDWNSGAGAECLVLLTFLWASHIIWMECHVILTHQRKRVGLEMWKTASVCNRLHVSANLSNGCTVLGNLCLMEAVASSGENDVD